MKYLLMIIFILLNLGCTHKVEYTKIDEAFQTNIDIGKAENAVLKAAKIESWTLEDKKFYKDSVTVELEKIYKKRRVFSQKQPFECHIRL